MAYPETLMQKNPLARLGKIKIYKKGERKEW